MPKISVVDDKGQVTPIKGANYHDVGDAAGDIDGGDFFSMVKDQFGEIKIVEIRILLEKPIEFKNDDDEDGD